MFVDEAGEPWIAEVVVAADQRCIMEHGDGICGEQLCPCRPSFVSVENRTELVFERALSPNKAAPRITLPSWVSGQIAVRVSAGRVSVAMNYYDSDTGETTIYVMRFSGLT